MSLATFIAELKPEVGLIQEMKALQGADNQVDSYLSLLCLTVKIRKRD